MQFVQTHGARWVAVDMDRLEAVLEKTLQSVFDRSMVVLVSRVGWWMANEA
jgi:hypothetical protein